METHVFFIFIFSIFSLYHLFFHCTLFINVLRVFSSFTLVGFHIFWTFENCSIDHSFCFYIATFKDVL
jgi:hypothetical protein